MKIVNLVENTQGAACCGAEHGLSFYIETAKHRILMDTGASELMLQNAEKLGIDLTKVDTVILSHGHYDHGGGIPAFLRINHQAKIYMQKTALGECYSVVEGKDPRYIGLPEELKEVPAGCNSRGQLVLVEGNYTIDEELSLFSGIEMIYPNPSANSDLRIRTENGFVADDFIHEQCLVIRQGKQRILLSGCAHHGILNVMAHYRKLYGSDPDAVISGFHMRKLNGYEKEDYKEMVHAAHELMKYRSVYYTGHCTGTKPYEVMKRIMGSRLHYVHSGDEIHLQGTDKGSRKGRKYMKWHRFFAWATVACFILTMVTGYQKK